MEPSSTHATETHGVEALLVSLAVTGIALGAVLVVAALMAPQYPRVRAVFHPLNITILVAQLLDGATTWVGVENPFGLNLPPYQETVFVSGLILEHLGGFVYFMLKLALALGVIAALEVALRGAAGAKERAATVLVQVALIVIGLIPVWNNVVNFVSVA